MQGSLDYPPLVIVGSRAKAAGYLAFFTFFFIVALFSTSVLAPLWAILYLAVMLLWGSQLILGLRLTISPWGIVLKRGFSTQQYPWICVANFRADRVSLLAMTVRCAMRKTPGDPVKTGNLGGGWECPTEQVAEILNQARARWIPQDAGQLQPLAQPYPPQPPQYAPAPQQYPQPQYPSAPQYPASPQYAPVQYPPPPQYAPAPGQYPAPPQYAPAPPQYPQPQYPQQPQYPAAPPQYPLAPPYKPPR